MLLAAVSLSVARTGRARDRQPLHDVAPGCATRAAWLETLRARLPPLLRTHPLLDTLSVHVTKVERRGIDSYAGEVTSSGGALDDGVRTVRGETCVEVLDALSFIAALGLERAATHTADEPAREALGHDAGAHAAAPDVGAVGVDASPAHRADASVAPRTRAGALGFALLESGLTPARATALGVALQLAWSGPAWQPLVWLGVSMSLPEERRLEGGGRARFEHWSTHAVACPWRLPATGAWGLRPCLELDVGRTRGEGRGVQRATRRSAPWLSGGAQLRIELTLWDRVELGASLAAVAPFWHAHFLVLPDQRAFETPAFGLRAGSYAGLLF